MTQPGDPPASPGSGRSIYERLGLLPPSSAARRAALPPPPRRPASSRRYLIAVPFFLAALAILWMALPAGSLGDHVSLPSAADEDERRMDMQDAQIKALSMRVEMLEVKVRALQELNGYPVPRASRSNRPQQADQRN